MFEEEMKNTGVTGKYLAGPIKLSNKKTICQAFVLDLTSPMNIKHRNHALCALCTDPFHV